MPKQIVSLSGKKGCGKSYVAHQIKQHLSKSNEEPSIKSFADPVRSIVKFITKTEYSTEELKQDKVKDEVALTISGTSFTFRQLLQLVGTEMGRSIHPDIWVDYMKRTLEEVDNKDSTIIIDDTRFPNEIDFINEGGSTSIYITSPESVEDDAHESEQHHPYLYSNCRYVLNNKKKDDSIQTMLSIVL